MNTPHPGGPIPVVDRDIVGYVGDGKFAILKPYVHVGRSGTTTVSMPDKSGGLPPVCTWCVVEDGQIVNLGGGVATLHVLDGQWFYQYRDERRFWPLISSTFFDIGDGK